MVQQPSLCSVGFKLVDLIHNYLVKAPFYLPSMCTLSQVKHSISVRSLTTHPLSPLRRSRCTLQHSQQTSPPHRSKSEGAPNNSLCACAVAQQMLSQEGVSLCNPTPLCHSECFSCECALAGMPQEGQCSWLLSIALMVTHLPSDWRDLHAQQAETCLSHITAPGAVNKPSLEQELYFD